ncbi:hypothetical protein [Nocardiopsis nanhaiensis]
MSDTSDFLALLVDAYTEERIEVELLPPARMLIHIPDNEPLEVDYSDPIAQALEFPAETHPGLARQSVHGMMRLVREKGIPLGTHYPLLSDDHARKSLVSAFAEQGVEAYFTEPNKMYVSKEDTAGTLDVAQHLAAVEGQEPEDARARADEYAAGTVQRLSDHLDTPVGVEQLRVRIYPEAAFPEGALPQLVARQITSDLWQTVVIDFPDDMQLLRRDQVGDETADEQVFAAAVENSLNEPVEVSELDAGGTPIVHIGGEQPYVLSHLHALERHLGETEHGALVVFPSPPVVMAHILGKGNPVNAMETLQELAERFVADTDKPVTAKLYWWRPNPGSSLPDLREVAIKIDHENKSISLMSADESFGPLLQSLVAES